MHIIPVSLIYPDFTSRILFFFLIFLSSFVIEFLLGFSFLRGGVDCFDCDPSERLADWGFNIKFALKA